MELKYGLKSYKDCPERSWNYEESQTGKNHAQGSIEDDKMSEVIHSVRRYFLQGDDVRYTQEYVWGLLIQLEQHLEEEEQQRRYEKSYWCGYWSPK